MTDYGLKAKRMITVRKFVAALGELHDKAAETEDILTSLEIDARKALDKKVDCYEMRAARARLEMVEHELRTARDKGNRAAESLATVMLDLNETAKEIEKMEDKT